MRFHRGAPNGQTRAFTLVELLIVVAVIGALLAIVLPVYAGARKRSCMAVDISNMRQLATAITLYRQDHGYAPYLLHDLDGAYVTSQDLYLSPADHTAPYGFWACEGPLTMAPNDPSGGLDMLLGGYGTYVYLNGCGEVAETIQAAICPDLYTRSVEEPGWGILACPVYMKGRSRGDKWITNLEGRRVQVRHLLYGYGTLLRVAADGSLRQVQWEGRQGMVFPYNYLMDGDVRMPESGDPAP